MRWFDSHAHLQDEKFIEDIDDVLVRAGQADVRRILLPGSDLLSVERAAVMSADKPDVFCFSAGIHPHEAADVDDAMFERTIKLAQGAAGSQAVAIGEVGLDYHYDFSPRPIQQTVFAQYIELSWELKLPLIIHSREATEDTIGILRKMAGRGRLLQVPGVFHCFSGSAQTAEILLDMGFYLGFDGPITFKNSRKAAEVISITPLSRIMIETDSPYLSPEPLRGRRNEPANIPYIGRRLAEIKGISDDEAAAATWANTVSLFNLADDR